MLGSYDVIMDSLDFVDTDFQSLPFLYLKFQQAFHNEVYRF